MLSGLTKKTRFLLIGLVVASFVAIGSGVTLMFFNSSSSSNATTMRNETTFFLQNAEGKYALFNEDGERLTDFIYDFASGVINGTAQVRLGYEEGVIDSNAKMVIDFGEYDTINSRSGLYRGIKDSKHYLLDSSGKVLYELGDDDEFESYDGSVFYSILRDEKKGKYYVLNVNGDVLKSFDISSNKEIYTSSLENYISVSYNNMNYIIDALTGDEVISFDNNIPYCIARINEDEETMILGTCSSSNSDTSYLFLTDGNVVDVNNECDRVFYNHFDRLICEKGNVEYLLDDNYKKSIEIAYISYKDDKNYAKTNRTGDNSVEFYNNGSLVKSVDCRVLGDTSYIYNDLYLLGTYYNRSCGTEAGNYEFYDSKGEKVIDTTDDRAENYDSFGNAKVSEDGVNYYLMNSEGEQVSSLYDGINILSIAEGYYGVAKNDLHGLIDKKGTEVIEPAYKAVTIYRVNDITYAIMTTDDDKNVVYDLNNSKEIITVNGHARLGENYIYTENNGMTQYYSYKNGKMFHEV